ncbi:HD domain-containing phosphohydrolase [Deinococcus hopiensis]|uniref:HD domain-containing phosphohydrolase n=1 Tax=Deinococcus hopiensis TaxID=309885 RepID=UPI000A023BB8|nr:HD domain-containing phosphohydrolase [Deinococcus hopiensis]
MTDSPLPALCLQALHDADKVAIPQATLLETVQLIPVEWKVIQRHPGIGCETLHHIPSLLPATRAAALYDQERGNGSGYTWAWRAALFPSRPASSLRGGGRLRRPDERTAPQAAWTCGEVAERLLQEEGCCSTGVSTTPF